MRCSSAWQNRNVRRCSASSSSSSFVVFFFKLLFSCCRFAIAVTFARDFFSSSSMSCVFVAKQLHISISLSFSSRTTHFYLHIIDSCLIHSINSCELKCMVRFFSSIFFALSLLRFYHFGIYVSYFLFLL